MTIEAFQSSGSLETLGASPPRTGPSHSPVEVVKSHQASVAPSLNTLETISTSTLGATTDAVGSLSIHTDVNRPVPVVSVVPTLDTVVPFLPTPVVTSRTNKELLRSVTVDIAGFDSTSIKDRLDIGVPFIPILEAMGGQDKDPATGLRRDSIPIGTNIAATKDAKCAVFLFSDDQDGSNEKAVSCNRVIFEHLLKTASGLIVRVNPGTIPPAAQTKLDNMLTALSDAGILVMSTPEVMRSIGGKDSLVKIKDLRIGLKDTAVYTTAESFVEGFRKTIAFQPRVLKQNRGSQGEGIWICKLKDESQYCKSYGDAIADFDTKIVLMEAYDNHVEEHTVAEFMEFCLYGRTAKSGEWASVGKGRYLEGGLEAGAMLVDQRFLPRIVEGEVRCTMVGTKLISLVHKKPKAGGVSATLKSGAIYTSYEPDDPLFSDLVSKFRADLPHIRECFGVEDQPLPLLWTADFIFGEKREDGSDTFIVGEFNASCVGITQQLEFAPLVAKTAIEYCTAGFSTATTR
mmetsp:Transcript_6842/g.9981  ORF Transcript_6842/g.9981 Transcript_6842/m.9981 type:complete len:516 (-) Transcript_6842:182-1729(-)|eukprot:CAMPEP_0194039972 /NCGR_PEP_ID=MMETSP0009_2-20130614/12043_1 /TAXON_ID=210454 /ORGANISM="Grammatophora oceanica, Strain CCMP 410" /LENGTH=515 /DNA_ID=CAMNT_0038682963 /DNA_START=106 /DNA_END=1653 /DNA_ORIENTATION=+